MAELGAEVFVSSRKRTTAEETRDAIRERGIGEAQAFHCDITSPTSVRQFAADVLRRTDRVDILVNNAARYLAGAGLQDAGDDEITDVIGSAAAGTVLVVKHFLPLLLRSAGPDIVTLVSACGEPGHHRSPAHEAFYAAKSAQAGFLEILSRRLRPQGVRVISLYPPDFVQDGPRAVDEPLTAASVIDCVVFAVTQPRDCFIKSFHFEQV